MRLAAGQTLSFYEILGPLGKGGMGEVYRARDTRLERDVALKVLPEVLVKDEQHLARFQREAKLLASLSHPNVATIYGVDCVDGIWFLALELVEGETLRQALARGPLPVADAMRAARRIAAGLQAAHEAGIVHRDLKPSNIMFGHNDSVKILDFGLAKQTEESDGTSEPLTGAFQVMGTPGYLSPEQARGEVATQRTDVWAFGCIFFECLTGTRAFPGETVGEAIRSTFEDTPEFESMPPGTPPTVRLLVSRCLSKDSAQRLRDIGDVKLLLDGASDEPSSTSVPIGIRKRDGARPNRRLAVALALLLAAACGIIFSLLGDPDLANVSAPGAHTLALPFGADLGFRRSSANLSKLGDGSPLLAMSPDGGRVAYCARDGSTSAIYLHEIGEQDSTRLEGTERGRAPFFSPDGTRLGFHARNRIWTVPVDGRSAPEEICAVASPNFAACWTVDGAWIVYTERAGLFRVRSTGDGSEPELIIGPRRPEEIEYFHPAAVDDNDHILFAVATGPRSHIAAVSMATRALRMVVRNGTSPRFAAGRVLYAHAGGIRARRFDPAAPEEQEPSEPVRERVFTSPGAGGGVAIAHFDVSLSGRLAFAPANKRKTRSTAYWVDRASEGKGRIIHSELGNWKHPRLAPDEQSFAVDILDDVGTKNIYVYRIPSGFVRWSEDGTSIMSTWFSPRSIVARSTHESARLRELSSNGFAAPAIPELDGIVYADCWSPRLNILFMTRRLLMSTTIWTYRPGDDAPRELITKDNARFGRISPDDRWLAYVGNVRGRPEVYVAPYDSPHERQRVSIDGGGEPVWSKSSDELFYRTQDGGMWAVAYETQPHFRVTGRKFLFRNDYDPEIGGHQHYDVSRDGRFLMIENAIPVPNRVHVVSMKSAGP